MFTRKKNGTKVSEIAHFLSKDFTGEDFLVYGVSPIEDIKTKTTIFLNDRTKKENIENVLVITTKENDGKYPATIYSDTPRLDFVKVMNHFFFERKQAGIHPNASISKKATIGKQVSIGENTIIGEDVVIGDETTILRNVVIDGKVSIGCGCIIKDNSVIGSEGFGFERDESGNPIHFPQVGSIEIGDEVMVGSCTTVERAALHKTIIENNVKIDDLVQIGHNCKVGERSMIAAGTILCGNVTIGKKCWVAPKSVIREKLILGDNAFIGLGSVVVKNVKPGETVYGNPSKSS